jgi:hypothetical protein
MKQFKTMKIEYIAIMIKSILIGKEPEAKESGLAVSAVSGMSRSASVLSLASVVVTVLVSVSDSLSVFTPANTETSASSLTL